MNTDKINKLETEIQAAFDGLVAATKSMDVDRYLSFFDQGQFTALNADGSVYHNFKVFEESYRQMMPMVRQYQSLEFSNVKITILNDATAILVNEYVAEVVLQTGDSISAGGAGTQVWSKSTGQWKLVNVSSSTKSHK